MGLLSCCLWHCRLICCRKGVRKGYKSDNQKDEHRNGNGKQDKDKEEKSKQQDDDMTTILVIGAITGPYLTHQ